MLKLKGVAGRTFMGYNTPNMIKFLRNKSHQKKLFIAMAVLIIPTFVFWGFTLDSGSGGTGDVAGRLGSKKISTGDFIKHFEATRRDLLLFQGLSAKEVQEQADLERLAWDRILLLEYAKQQRINVSNQEVVAWLSQQTAFQTEGQFNSSLYKSFVERQLRLTPRDFEENVRDSITLQKAAAGFTNAEPLNEVEAKAMWGGQFAKRDLKYLYMSASDLDDPPTVDEDEVKNQYELAKDNLNHPESVDVRYVLIKSDSEGNTEAIRSQILVEGLDEAKNHGLKVVEVSDLTRQNPIPAVGYSNELTQAIFTLDSDNPITPWLDSQKGKVIFELVSKTPSRAMSYEEAGPLLKTQIQEQKSIEGLLELAGELRNKMSLDDFDTVSDEAGFEVLQAEKVGAFDYLEKAGPLLNFGESVAVLKEGEISAPIRVIRGVVLAQVEKIHEADDAAWAEQKEEFIQTKQRELLYKSYDEKMRALRKDLQINYRMMEALFGGDSK
jgi:hypothetical protein